MICRITQTLLSALDYVYKTDDGYPSFLKTLNRVKEPPTQAMLNGQRFEGMVNSALDGKAIPPDHEWAELIAQCKLLLDGSQQQVTLFREIEVEGQTFLLHGVLDFLRCGVIYDTKFSTTYKVGKYLNSPQHPMYFRLVPEAYKFQYVICDGHYIYKETYTPDMVEPIEKKIARFWAFLNMHPELKAIYQEKWRTG